MTVTIDRGDFWEFKARCAELDLEMVKLRMQLSALGQRKNALVDAFATKHRLDPMMPMTLEDTDCTVTQR